RNTSVFTAPLPSRPTLFPYTTLFRSIRKEVCPFVRKQGVAPTIQVVHAPVFYGYTFAAFAEAESAIKREKLAEVCEKAGFVTDRSEEHTSELQSPDQLVCRLLLEKKK